MRVRYTGGRSIAIKGPVTGKDYRFSGIERLQLMDPRDAVRITKKRYFRVEGVVEKATR
jgi:hypothetical protein